MLLLVLLDRDGTFRGIYKFSTYYEFLINVAKEYYCYKLYESLEDGTLNCIKEKL